MSDKPARGRPKLPEPLSDRFCVRLVKGSAAKVDAYGTTKLTREVRAFIMAKVAHPPAKPPARRRPPRAG